MFDEGQFLTLIRDANNENYAWGTKKAAGWAAFLLLRAGLNESRAVSLRY